MIDSEQNLASPGGSRVAFHYATVDRSTPVRLDILTIQGRLVRSLADGPVGSGTHVLSWDRRSGSGASLARGVYLARLTTPRAAVTRKFVMTHRAP